MPALFEQGLYVTDIPALSLEDLPSSLKNFCLREETYRHNHLQSRYGIAFDGYSWPGQPDSLNQGPEDQLHSFVFSDFYPAQRYPEEFHCYLAQCWPAVSSRATALEHSLLKRLGLNDIAARFEQDYGHMMSANYYPPATAAVAETPGLRLSAHPDVSLFTVFLFGMGGDFQFQNTAGSWVDAPVTDRVVVFAGDLLQWLTDGDIPALNHRVKRSPGPLPERFSFALFSLPRPDAILSNPSGQHLNSEEWFSLHLSQWD